MKVPSLCVTSPGNILVAEVDVPTPGPGEVLVRTVYSAVSPGTELRCLQNVNDSVPVFPFVPGYSMSGIVTSSGPGAQVAEGCRVFCTGTAKSSVALQWGGHIGYAVRDATSVYPLPETVDMRAASITKLAAIAYRGARLAQAGPGKTVAVVGLGPIGQLSARIHSALGAHVVAGDRASARVALSEAVGIRSVLTGPNIPDAFREWLPDGADIVVDATGAHALIPQLIGLARDKPWDDSEVAGPRYIVQGSYPADFAIPYQAAFMKELSFYLPRDTQPRDVLAVLKLIAEGRLYVNDLISITAQPEAAPGIYSDLLNPDSSLITAAFEWSAD